MRSVLRDRDHLVLHRARARPKKSPDKKMKGDIVVSKEKRSQPRDIKVHFRAAAEPFSFSPKAAAPPVARGVHGLTELFRLVEIQKYSLAIQRLYQFPKEASMWVGVSAALPEEGPRLLEGTDDPSLGPPARVGRGCSPSAAKKMMLPVHLACEHLRMHPKKGGASDKRRKVEALVAHLVSVFPASCLRRNPRGQLPLHAALRNGASVETVTALLCAAPEALVHVDTSSFPHLTPSQINNQLLEELAENNKGSNGGGGGGGGDVDGDEDEDDIVVDASAAMQEEEHRLDVVRQMLGRGIEFWDMAKQEATLRIKHRNIPPEDASIGSTSVLATSFNNDDSSTLATSLSQSQRQNQPLHHFQYRRSGHQKEPVQQQPQQQNRRRRLTLHEQHLKRAVRPTAVWRRNSAVSFLKRSHTEGDEADADADADVDAAKGRSGSGDDPAVSLLLDRIRALERDKVQLQSEVQMLQSELARRDCDGLGTEPSRSAIQNMHELATPPRRTSHRGGAGPEAGMESRVVLHKLQKEKESLERKVDALTKSNHVYQRLLQSFTSLNVNPEARKQAAAPLGGETGTEDGPDDGRCNPTSNANTGDALPSEVMGPPKAAMSTSRSPPWGPALPYEFDVDSVILRAEQLAGHRLSQELVDAWRAVARSSDSVSELGSSSDGQRDVSPLGDDDDADDLDGADGDDDMTCLYSTSSHSTDTPGPSSVL